MENGSQPGQSQRPPDFHGQPFNSWSLQHCYAIFPFPSLALLCVLLHLVIHLYYHGAQTISISSDTMMW